MCSVAGSKLDETWIYLAACNQFRQFNSPFVLTSFNCIFNSTFFLYRINVNSMRIKWKMTMQGCQFQSSYISVTNRASGNRIFLCKANVEVVGSQTSVAIFQQKSGSNNSELWGRTVSILAPTTTATTHHSNSETFSCKNYQKLNS